MERGFCSLGGAEKYSPELVQRRALESPAAAARVALRGGEMLWRLGLFACSLLADNLAGLSEESDRVRLRARQLRCAVRRLHMRQEGLAPTTGQCWQDRKVCKDTSRPGVVRSIHVRKPSPACPQLVPGVVTGRR